MWCLSEPATIHGRELGQLYYKTWNYRLINDVVAMWCTDENLIVCAHEMMHKSPVAAKKKTIKEFKLIKIQLRFFCSLILFFPIHLTFSETSFIQYFNFGCLDLIFIRFDVLFRFFSFSLFVWTVWLKANEMRASVRTCMYCEPKFNWRFDAVHHIASTNRCSTLCVYFNRTFFSHFSWGDWNNLRESK